MDKATLNAIRALRKKTERSEQKRFVVEGDKSVGELVESSIAIERMYYVSTMEHAVPDSQGHLAEQISVKDMARISQMNTAGRTDGRTGGRSNGRADGRTDGRTEHA